MQVTNDFVILARDVSVDAKDQMLSVFKIIDKFNLPLDPDTYKRFLDETKDKSVTLPAMYVMSSSWRLQEKVKKDTPALLESRIIDPSGKELGKSVNEIVFVAGSDKLRLNGLVEGIPVIRNGRYKVELSILDATTNKKLCSSATTYEVEVVEGKF
ncbi:MAG TPA: hypothetical protein VF733_00135 [Candidatus Saccharimonadales bacterium]